MKGILYILLTLWELPQTIVGAILLGYYRPAESAVLGMKHYPDRIFYYSDRMPGGISLGNIIILNKKYKKNSNDHYHEYGHSKQSLFLGPLYLLVIGIPSILWAWYHQSHRKRSYYWFYTERWADKLGGVVR